jgi:hypothetical protein
MTLEEQLRSVLQDPARTPSLDFRDQVLAALPARQRPRPWLVRGLVAPLGAAAVLAVVLVVGSSMSFRNAISPPATPASPETSATATSSPSPSAPAPSSIATYPDGIPREIDGEPVLRGDAIAIEAAERTDDRPFLIGGYGVIVLADCMIDPSAPTSPLIESCGGGRYLRDGPSGGVGVRFVIDEDFEGPSGGGGPQILRVHVHDERAAACAKAIRLTCEHTMVAETQVWAGPMAYRLDADGIPVEIEREAVLRGDAITAQIAAATNDQSFLVGGWATGQIGYRCLATSPDDPPPPALVACGAPALFLMDGPDRQDGHTVVAVPPARLPVPGRAVLRVHVHDVLAAQCEPAARSACEAKLVLESVVWTEPAP